MWKRYLPSLHPSQYYSSVRAVSTHMKKHTSFKGSIFDMVSHNSASIGLITGEWSHDFMGVRLKLASVCFLKSSHSHRNTLTVARRNSLFPPHLSTATKERLLGLCICWLYKWEAKSPLNLVLKAFHVSQLSSGSHSISQSQQYIS